MINEIIYWELYALVVSFFNGVLLAWIYDNIRAFRRIVRHKTVVFMSVEDIIYGIYAGLSVFVMCFKETLLKSKKSLASTESLTLILAQLRLR